MEFYSLSLILASCILFNTLTNVMLYFVTANCGIVSKGHSRKGMDVKWTSQSNWPCILILKWLQNISWCEADLQRWTLCSVQSVATVRSIGVFLLCSVFLWVCLTRSKGVFSALYSIILHCNTCEHYAEYGVCLTSLTRSKGVFSAGDFPGPCCRQGLASQCHPSLRIVHHASLRIVDVHSVHF